MTPEEQAKSDRLAREVISDKCPVCGAVKYPASTTFSCGSRSYKGLFEESKFCIERQLSQANERYEKVSANRDKWRAKVGEQDIRIAELEMALNAIPSINRLTCSINFRREIIEDKKKRRAEAKLAAAEALKGKSDG